MNLVKEFSKGVLLHCGVCFRIEGLTTDTCDNCKVEICNECEDEHREKCYKNGNLYLQSTSSEQNVSIVKAATGAQQMIPCATFSLKNLR